MYKIRLLLADYDSMYIDKFIEYINSNFATQIKISTFTQIELLHEHLKSSHEKTDILLAHSDFLQAITDYYSNIELVIALSDGSLNSYSEQVLSINKYQPGDRLVNRLIELYSEKNVNAAKMVSGTNHTKIIALYSPAGGTGKTSLTLGLAANLAELEFSVLCLSLEYMNSMATALLNAGNHGFSHALFCLKDNPETLSLKIEKHKTTDPNLSIDYLEPPECFTELSEIDTKDLTRLLVNLRKMARYDYVLVDMESAADDKTLSVLGCSDKIILIQGPDCSSHVKTDIFLNQVKRTGISEATGLFEKSILVVNKFTGNMDLDLSHHGLQTRYYIPYVENLWVFGKESCSFDLNSRLRVSLTALAQLI